MSTDELPAVHTVNVLASITKYFSEEMFEF